MKILVVAWHLIPSEGWGTAAKNIIIGLQNRGHEVIALVEKKDNNIEIEQYEVLHSPLICIKNPIHILCLAWDLLRYDRKLKPDIIHFMAEPYLAALPFTFGLLKAKTTVTACGTWSILPLEHTTIRTIFLRAYSMISHVLVISNYTKKRLLEAVRKRRKKTASQLEKKISIFTLSIDSPENLQPAPDNSVKKILFVGEVKSRKGVMELIEGCGEFSKQYSTPFTCDIIGGLKNLEYVSRLQERITELGLEDVISLKGHVSDEELHQAYSSADLFMMLSKPYGVNFEGYGLVFLEANARGIPVIGPNGSGCVDAIAEGISGYTVDPDDPHAIANSMKKILIDNEIDRKNAYDWAKDHSHEDTAKQIEAVYKAMLS